MGVGSRSGIVGFRDLRVWQAGMDLVQCGYTVTAAFPTSEVYGLSAQIRRAAVSIPSNIAEGHGRQHRRDYAQFLSMAQGSRAELQTQIEITKRLGCIGDAEGRQVSADASTLSKQLHARQNTVERSPNSRSANPQPPNPNPTSGA